VYHLSLRAALAGGGKDGGKDSGKGFDPDDPEFVDRIARTIHIGNLANEATSLNHSAAHGCCTRLLPVMIPPISIAGES
jgi:hypothetical protein